MPKPTVLLEALAEVRQFADLSDVRSSIRLVDTLFFHRLEGAFQNFVVNISVEGDD